MAKYIKTIQIQNLWSKGNIEWEINEDVSVLVGMNGSGKTTILNIIYEALSKNEAEINYKQFDIVDEVRIYFGDKSFIKVGDWLRSFVGGKFEDIKIDKIDTFDVITPNNTKSILDSEIDKLKEPFVRYQRNLLEKSIAKNLSVQEKGKNFQRKNTFIKFINDLFKETQKKFIEDTFSFKIGRQSNTITPNQLSSGEKQIFLILLKVLLQDGQPYILLMDEPEISLHITWQRKLLMMIRALNPKCQVILVTHSPSVYFKGWADKIFRIDDITKGFDLKTHLIIPTAHAISVIEFIQNFEKESKNEKLNKVHLFNFHLGQYTSVSYEEAEELITYLDTKDINPDIITFTTLMSQVRAFNERKKLLNIMEKKGIAPTLKVFNSMITASTGIKEGFNIFELMEKKGILPNIDSFSSLLRKARTPKEVIRIEDYRMYYSVSTDPSYISIIRSKM